MEVLHLDYRPGTAGWVLPLQTHLATSSSETLQGRYQQWEEQGLAELGIAVATRFAQTLRVPFLLGQLLQRLRDEIEESSQIDELLEGEMAFSPKDTRILYDICVLIDAFYFEYRSCYEVVGKFVVKFGECILDKTISEADLKEVLRKAGHDVGWIESVREDRKLFFHQTAPWIALRINERNPLNCSLLVLKENLQEFSDPEKYVTQQQLVDSISGLQKGMWAVQEWLEAQIVEVEQPAS